ncbi:MAG: HAMP domain-containing sensor histidine kinase [Fuerstiella sp.]
MINYRGLKKLLGETSLERKCRLLFGVALMILITTSFWIYAGRTRQLVEGQQIVKARTLIPEMLWRRHVLRFARRRFEELTVDGATTQQATQQAAQQASEASDPDSAAVTADGTDHPSRELQTEQALSWTEFEERLTRVQEFKMGGSWDLILPEEAPGTDEGFEAMLHFKNDGLERHFFRDNPESGGRELYFFAAVRATENCLSCHSGQTAAAYTRDEFVAMASITVPMDDVEGELSRNRAILLFSAIVTTFIAMLVAYIIVRYIIVKPVQHLKDVSDEIARGNLNLRAEINTGDEFEELSHAFNRMLRHMTTVNDELRSLNDNLDAKVDQLAQANMELFKSNALKDEFLATMSHELRTPLNSILGFSDVLGNAANLDDRQKRYVENIRTSGRNLMVQINDLLDIAKIESGRMKLQPGHVNLADLIDHQCNQIMPLADQKNIELRVRHLTSPLPALNQDGSKIRQILTNLLSNAIKFTPEGGRVRVTTEIVDDEAIQICVEDTGIGIPMQEQSEIFEKFRQGTTVAGERDHVKREYGGTGLGLSIVRELSRLLGGDVQLESEFGKGSMFTVRIPVLAPPEKADTHVSLDSPSDAARSKITSVDLLNTTATSSPETDSSETSSRDGAAHDPPASEDNDHPQDGRVLPAGASDASSTPRVSD